MQKQILISAAAALVVLVVVIKLNQSRVKKGQKTWF